MSDYPDWRMRISDYPDWRMSVPVRQMGCICPPTSEKTCQNPLCPRKSVKTETRHGTARSKTDE